MVQQEQSLAGKEVFSFVVITVSDKGSMGLREDKSGILVSELLKNKGFVQEDYTVIPDDEKEIREKIKFYADKMNVDLVVTNGGTGVAPRDRTPEATREVLDREIPGMAEAMRSESLQKTPHAMLSRAVCGIRKNTLIVNLPGSPKAAKENLAVIIPALPHAIKKIKGDPTECATP